MSYPSRHLRPTNPRPLVLQQRDHDLVHSLYRHRYLLADHIHRLQFKQASLRVTQHRLRQLWEHHHIDRLSLPLQHAQGVTLSPPLYSLAAKGAQVVGCDINVAPSQIPHTPKANAKGFATLLHNLIATDLLVAAEGCNTEDLAVTVQQEFTLRQALARARTHAQWRGQALVPDGAVHLFPRGNNTDPFRPGNNSPTTYYLEVVRAGVKSGDRHLLDKCRLYADLHHRGFFHTVFGHGRVRAVLFLTTSPERAEHFRQLAATLHHGRNLFWFGAYTPPPAGRLVPVLAAQHLCLPIWRTVDGTPTSLIPSPSLTASNLTPTHV